MQDDKVNWCQYVSQFVEQFPERKQKGSIMFFM